jgi:hypothetical protein
LATPIRGFRDLPSVPTRNNLFCSSKKHRLEVRTSSALAISLKDKEPIQPPEQLPPDVEAAFAEGGKCLAIDCFNAAGTMFRLAIDLSTRPGSRRR